MRRPLTPPSTNKSEWRFYPVGAPTEWIEHYHLGGLHPIHIGDLLDGHRYKILRKLGYGSFSTVWLARDTRQNRYVAIKVAVARSSETSKELGIFEHLASRRGQRGARHVIELLGSFEHQGPNGRHLCLVFPVMGPNASTMVEQKFWPDRRLLARYPLPIAKSMLKQLLGGLNFLHQNGITHNAETVTLDIQPGNILFSLPNIASVPESELQTDITQPNTISDPIKRFDGSVDPWSPRYTAIPQPLTSYEPDFTIQISDMGGASLVTANMDTPITPVSLRAPELILRRPWNAGIDVWSFGCLLFQFLTGRPLLIIGTWGLTDEEIDDEHLKQLIAILGPLPPDLRAQWPRYSLSYADNGSEIVPREGDAPPLETYFKEMAPPEMTTEEVEAVGALLEEILQYNSAKRPTAADLLENPWFQAIGEPEIK